jgi:four helix bundle protein
MSLVEESYRLAARLPPWERYNLSAQIRSASTSIPANIAEGHGSVHRRQYLRYVIIAEASLRELETHLENAVRVHHVAPEEARDALRLAAEVGRLLGGLHRALKRPKKDPPNS